MTTTIRAAGAGDVELVAALGIRTYRDHYSDLWSPEGLAHYLARHFDRATLAAELAGDGDVRYVVAFAGAEAVGFAKVVRDQPVPTRPRERGLELQKIYFTRAATGHGHGAHMIEHVVELAVALAQPCVWLDVLKSNVGGLRFYERHGFVRIGETPFASDVRDIGMWVMRRRLSDGED